MKPWHKIVIALIIAQAIILLIVGGTLWWIPYHELSRGQLAIVDYSSNSSTSGIYLFNPLFRSWRRLPTANLYPYNIAWSPDGKKLAFTYSLSSADDAHLMGIAILTLQNMQTQQVYSSPSNESLNGLTWSPDGHSLVFDVYENNTLTAFQELDIFTMIYNRFPFLKASSHKILALIN